MAPQIGEKLSRTEPIDLKASQGSSTGSSDVQLQNVASVKKPRRTAKLLCYLLPHKCLPLGNRMLAVFSATLDEFLSKVYYRYGKLVAKFPVCIILASILLSLTLGVGFIQFTEQYDGEKLWVPQDLTELKQHQWLEDTFGGSARLSTVIVFHSTQDSDVMTSAFTGSLFSFYDAVVAKTSDYSDTSLQTYEQVCYKPNGKCDTSSVLEWWSYDSSNFTGATDSTVKTTVTSSKTKLSGGTIYSSNVISSLSNVGTTSAYGKAYLMTFPVERRETTTSSGLVVDDVADNWESALIDVVREYNNTNNMVMHVMNDYAWSDESSSAFDGDFNLIALGYFLIISYTTIMLSRLDLVRARGIISACAVISVGMALVASFGLSSAFGVFYSYYHGLLPFLLVGIGVDDAFILVRAFDLTDKSLPMDERMGLMMKHAGLSITVTSLTDLLAFAIGGATTIPALGTFCIYASLGIFFDFVFQVTFFSAVLVFDGQRQKSQRMECCPIFTVSHRYIPIPPFAPKKCVKPLIDHKAPAWMVLEDESKDREEADSLAQEARKLRQNPTAALESMDVEVEGGQLSLEEKQARLAEIQNRQALLKKHKWLRHAYRFSPFSGVVFHSFFSRIYTPILMWTPVRLLVLLATFGFFGASIYGTTQLTQEQDVRDFLPTNSYLHGFFTAQDDYFSSAYSPVYLVVESFTSNAYNFRTEIADLSTYIMGLRNVVSSAAISWYDDFRTWYIDKGNTSAQFDALDQTTFYSELETFLATTEYTHHADNIVFTDSNKNDIQSMRIYVLVLQPYDSDAQLALMDSAETASNKSTLNVFGYHPFFWFWAHYRILAAEMAQNLCLAMFAVLVITLAMIAHPMAALMVFLSVALTCLSVLGFGAFMDLKIDIIFLINMVICIGLSVDYSAHVGHSFMAQEGKTRRERAHKALSAVGESVANGVISTFLAVVLLSQSVTVVFVLFFKQIVLVLLFGTWHGLVFLPVLLSFAGPARANLNRKEEVGATAKVVDGKIQPSEGEIEMMKKGGKNGKSTGSSDTFMSWSPIRRPETTPA